MSKPISTGYQCFAPGAGMDDFNLMFWRWGNHPSSRVVLVDDVEHLTKDSYSGTS